MKTRIQEMHHILLYVMTAILILIGSVLTASLSEAATYYLVTTGSDLGSGTSASPWRTFSFAISRLKPGDTLIVRNGTYTSANSGFPYIHCGVTATNGTATQPITIRAENERRAFINGDGSVTSFQIRYCSFWNIEGLRISAADNANGNGSPAWIDNSNNINVRRLIVAHNNRYHNFHLLFISSSSNILVEESEFYYFHRHGISIYFTNNSIFRRNYFNSRDYADIPGGRASAKSERGDEAIANYPGSFNIFENNISEGNERFADNGGTQSSKWLGNISLNDYYGATVSSRGETEDGIPKDSFFKGQVVINSLGPGIWNRNARNMQCQNCTVIDSGSHGILADMYNPSVCCPPHSAFFENTLVVNAQGGGITMIDQNSWGIAYSNVFNSSPNLNPPISPNITNTRSIDPQLGTCKVFIPLNSPMKGGGKDGADIGANVLYRYENGVLTNQPLWNPITGEFPHGAIVPGVNNIPGSSAFDVHRRLNVNANGCSLPAGYGGESASAPSPPRNLQTVPYY